MHFGQGTKDCIKFLTNYPETDTFSPQPTTQMKTDITSQIVTLKSLPVTSLIPEEWSSWFWSLLSQGDMTWGDTDHTLVSAERFLLCFNEIVEELIGELSDIEMKAVDIRSALIRLQNENVFIDLES